MKKHHEEGNLEDRHSGHRINPHGSPDCPRHYELHGPRPNSILRKEITLSTTKELTAPTSAVGLFFARNVP